MKGNENNISDQELNEEDVDLQKSLDDDLEKMNDLIKSKKTLTKEDVQEYMKNKKNKNLFKEYMKGEKNEDEDEDEGEDEEKMKGKKKNMKKSLDDICEEHDEVIDAVPVLKSFSKILEKLGNKFEKIESSLSNLQKSFDENQELQKSFAGVMNSQSELIKSVNSEIKIIGNTPNQRKGKVTTKDLLKSSLDNDFTPKSKLSGASVEMVKGILLKSVQSKEFSSNSLSKWELSGYNLGSLNKQELSFIESKLQ